MPTQIVEIISRSHREDIEDLGSGTVFGSEKIDDADELRLPLSDAVDPVLRALILYLTGGSAIQIER